MKKSIQDLKESLRKKEQKQQRLHEQEDKIEKDIRVLRYLIEREEQAASAQAPRKRKIARKQVSDFFTRIALFYEDLQRRLGPAHHLPLLLPLALHPLRVRVTLPRPPQVVALHGTGVF
ncbi:hypothetical protein NXW46_17790 [Bacteroides fragilis]|nr:hypothetical protein NXW46_17790 [Bacteroides fragilis]